MQCRSSRGRSMKKNGGPSGLYCRTMKKIVILHPKFISFKEEGMHNWSLKGKVNLFEFELISNAKKALQSGRRMFMDKLLFLGILSRWSPIMGRYRKGVHVKEAWMRVVDLLVHLWDKVTFFKTREHLWWFCGNRQRHHILPILQCAKVLVKVDGRNLLILFNVVVGSSCFVIQLWSEFPPLVEQVRILWRLLFDLFGIHWVQAATIKEALLRWHSLFVGKKCKKVWRAAFLCIFWMVWTERNLQSFDNEEHSSHFLKMFFLRNLFTSVKKYIRANSMSLLDFV